MKTYNPAEIERKQRAEINAGDRAARKATRAEQTARRRFYQFRAAYNAAAAAINAGARLRVSVSNGNSKMGAIPSISLLPLVTCAGGFNCPCAVKCYAAKIAALYSNTLKAYARNTALALHAPAVFWEQFRRAVAGLRFFRLNVAGDIPSAAFLRSL